MAKYEGNDFLEWYRKNYGAEYQPGTSLTRTSGMTDEDWSIGQSLFSSYQSGQALDQNYGTKRKGIEDNYTAGLNALEKGYENAKENQDAIYRQTMEDIGRAYGTGQEALDQSRKTARNDAEVTLKRLQKYIPELMRSNGMQGSGLSESSMVAAYGSKARTLANIEAGYQQNAAALGDKYASLAGEAGVARQNNLRDIETAYGSKRAELEASRNSALADLEGKRVTASADQGISAVEAVSKIVEQHRTEGRSDGAALFTSLENTIKGGTYTDAADMINTIEGFRGTPGMTDAMIESLKVTAKTVADNNLKAENEKNAGKTEGQEDALFNEFYTLIAGDTTNDPEAMKANIQKAKDAGVSGAHLAILEMLGDATVRNAALSEAERKFSYYYDTVTKLQSATPDEVTTLLNQAKADLGDGYRYELISTLARDAAKTSGNAEQDKAYTEALNLMMQLPIGDEETLDKFLKYLEGGEEGSEEGSEEGRGVSLTKGQMATLKAIGSVYIKAYQEQANQVAAATAESVLVDMISMGDYASAARYLKANVDVLKDVYRQYAENITISAGYDSIDDVINAAKDEKDAAEKDEETQRIIEGREYVKFTDENGVESEYKVTKKLADNANQIVRNETFTNALKEKFGSTNPYSKEIPDGTVIKITSDNSGANDFWTGFSTNTDSWWTLLFTVKTEYLVYLDGDWYLCKKK